MVGQGMEIGDTGRQDGRGSFGLGLDDAHDLQVRGIGHKLFHEIFVAGFIQPDAMSFIISVAVGLRDDLEGLAEKIVIRIGAVIFRQGDVLVLCVLLQGLVQLGLIAQAQSIEGVVRDAAVRIQHQNTFVVVFGPAPGLDVVLVFVQLGGLGHLAKDVRAHHGGHDAGGGKGAAVQLGKGGVRVYLINTAVGILTVDQRRNGVGVFHSGGVILNGAFVAVQIILERGQVVDADAGGQLGEDVPHGHHALRRGGRRAAGGAERIRTHQRSEIEPVAGDLQRILRQGGLFHILDITIDTVGQRKDQRDADDADGTGKCREQGAGLFGEQIVEAQ